MDVNLTLSVPGAPIRYVTGIIRDPVEGVTMQPRWEPGLMRMTEPETATPLLRVDAAGMSVMAVVALLRETADQLDDQRYLEMNGETPPHTKSESL